MDLKNLKEQFVIFVKKFKLPIVLTSLFVMAVVGAVITRSAMTPNLNETQNATAITLEDVATIEPAESPIDDTIGVHIKGAVNQPGYYELENNSRVKDAVEKSGGFTANADVDKVNLAEPLYDAEEVSIPKIGAAALVPGSASSGSSSCVAPSPVSPKRTLKPSPTPRCHPSATKDVVKETLGKLIIGCGVKININQAGLDELCRLPDVGKSTAEKIIATREALGGFKSIDEIKNVPGIGDKKFNKLKDFIAI